MIPIKTDLKLKKTPYANYALIVINFLVFALTYCPHTVNYGGRVMLDPLKEWASMFILNSAHPQIWQFVTYAFLHSSYQHIIGNMFFLYLFGSNVNDRLGNTGYTCFYFAGAIFAAIGFALLHDTAVLGASGAVAAVTGAYLVLFPRSIVTVIYWFFLIGTVEVPAIWFILLKMVIIDNVIQAKYMSSPIAYSAHLSGYAFGIISISLLLAAGLLKKSKFDIFGLFSRRKRRLSYRLALRQIYSSGAFNTDAKLPPGEQKIKDDIYTLRAEISALLSRSNLHAAVDKYLDLIRLDINQILPLRQQLDIANYLMSTTHYKQASFAYEKFINGYPDYDYIEQIYLMLGILYARYLNQKEQAVKYLQMAGEKLTDPAQKQMCESELKKLF